MKRLSTISCERLRRPLHGEGSTAIRTNGASLMVLVSRQRVTLGWSRRPIAPVGHLLTPVRMLQRGEELRLTPGLFAIDMAQQELIDRHRFSRFTLCSTP